MRTQAAQKKIENFVASETITLSKLARDMLEEYEGNVDLAKEAVIERLETEHWLLSEIAEAAIKEAVSVSVGHAHRAERAAIIRSIAPASKINFAQVTASLVNEHRRFLLDFPLAGGVKLRDATKAQVIEQAERYGATETDARRKRVWLESIAKSLKDNQVVSDVLSESKAIKLFNEAGNV